MDPLQRYERALERRRNGPSQAVLEEMETLLAGKGTQPGETK